MIASHYQKSKYVNLYIYGSGRNGCELSDVAESINRNSSRWESIKFVDDIREEREWYQREVVKFDEMLADPRDFEAVISLGEPVHRETLYNKLKANNVALATLIHPTAEVSQSAIIGEGTIVSTRSFISSNTVIAKNVMVEVNTIIGHDIKIEDNSVISSCSVIGGGTHIGKNSFIGMSCSIKEDIEIGDYCIVGMGSCVFKDIDDNLVAMGNPARAIRRNEDKRVFK